MKKGKQVSLNSELLEKEIRQQTNALHRISRWIKYALVATSIGVLLIYLGFTQEDYSLILKISGFVLSGIGVIIAIVFGYAHRNGQNNVKKMIDVLEKQFNENKEK